MDITELLSFSEKQGASDLHLSVGLPPMIRVNGEIQRLDLPALNQEGTQAMLHQIMGDRQRKEYADLLECDFSFEIPGIARFRANVFNHRRGAAGVFRVIPPGLPTLEGLDMGAGFRRIAEFPRGLVLVTGPTGSGKSTSLAAMLDYINDTHCRHILTLEDPVEFIHESKQCLVSQREIHRDTLGFNEALRSALREDPDIILVGEMRDLETIRLALEAAETGHLVFATLHTASAAKTIDRVIGVFPAAEQNLVRSILSESLQAVVSQSLLKKVGGGRVAAREVMICTPAIRNQIREDKLAQVYSAIQTGGEQGMQTLDQSLRELLERRVITGESARGLARMPDDFR